MKKPKLKRFICFVLGWALISLFITQIGIAEDILPITQEIASSFEYIDNPYSDKVWRTAMCIIDKNNFNEESQAYPALFFNSIWLTNEEFGKLLQIGEVNTQYRGKEIKIRIID